MVPAVHTRICEPAAQFDEVSAMYAVPEYPEITFPHGVPVHPFTHAVWVKVPDKTPLLHVRTSD